MDPSSFGLATFIFTGRVRPGVVLAAVPEGGGGGVEGEGEGGCGAAAVSVGVGGCVEGEEPGGEGEVGVVGEAALAAFSFFFWPFSALLFASFSSAESF